MYQLGVIDFESAGIIAGKAPDSDLALSGAWDMPERTGKTYQVWAEDDGIEPFVREDEIFFAGRDISFYGFIKTDDRTEAQIVVQDFLDQVDGLHTLVPLTCPWGTWNVYVKQGFTIEYVGQGLCKVQLNFREPVVDLSGIIPVADDLVPSIDRISFAALGLIKLKTTDQFNRPETKTLEFTNYGSEGYKIGKRSLREFNIQFVTKQPNYAAYTNFIQSLYAIFSSPGVRTLKLDDGTIREVFIKDGFKVTKLYKDDETIIAVLDVKFTEVRALQIFNLLTTQGLTLVDKRGMPLTEVLKKY